MPVTLRPSPQDETSSRVLAVVLGVMNLVVLGMILYLRFGPFARMLARFEERGVVVPAWIPLLMNAGVLVVGAYLAWRGISGLRKGLGGRSGPPAA